MRPSRCKTPGRTGPISRQNSNSSTDEVGVLCRVRPLPNENEESCVEVLDESTILLKAPETVYSRGTRDMQYGFKRVFDSETSQKEVFDTLAKPLVEDVLNAKNALLFTYGVTGSGKTYTMQGTDRDGGLVPRSIDVIFNSLGDRLIGQRYVFKPDGLNGFAIQSVVDAKVEEQREMINKIKKTNTPVTFARMNSSDHNLSKRMPETDCVQNVDENQHFAVFVNYVEIYNNDVYDLLDTEYDIISGRPKNTPLQVRKDSYDNMFVYKCTEVEVKSANEALTLFYQGQKLRKVAETQLNRASSRSHSIFTIRICKAPWDPTLDAPDGNYLTVSELSLVDLAGSERTNKTKNVGQRLAEAGKINNSLMTLRSCIEALRENQKSNSKRKMVPYRDSRLTFLFKNYFEGGEGAVKMLVCVNPRAEEYDENINVMQFAEMAQEIQIERVDPVFRRPRVDFMTPGRKRGDEVFKGALRKDQESSNEDLSSGAENPIYSLGPPWPKLSVEQCDDSEDILDNLERFLERRIATRNTLVADHEKRKAEFRRRLVEVDEEAVLSREENCRLVNENDELKRRVKELEERLVNAEVANRSLSRKIGAYSETKRVLETELDEKELLINQQKKDQKKIVKKYQSKIHQKDELIAEREQILREQELKKMADIRDRAKLRAVKQILNDKNLTISDPDLRQYAEGDDVESVKDLASRRSLSETPGRRRSQRLISNPRAHRRSRSVGAEKWVDHQPEGLLDEDALMKPVIKKRKSVTRLSEKDLDVGSKYVLRTQEQDSQGEMETKLYKGDVLPTTGGGRQIVFKDVEVLRHEEPTSPDRGPKKRSYEAYCEGIGQKIAAIEGMFNEHDQGRRRSKRNKKN